MFNSRTYARLYEAENRENAALEAFQNITSLGPEGWVPTQYYERAMEFCKQTQADTLVAAASEEERAEIMGHWFWDDMGEEK